MELVRFFFSFSGQVNRAKYWIGVGIVFAVSLLALLFWSALPIMDVQVALVWLVICGVAFLALAAKRLHDLGKSGWGVLGFAILWVLIWASGFDLGSLAAVAFGVGIIWLGSAQGVMELGYVRTDFGPGTIAGSFYLLSSALCFGLLMMITRPPRDLEITTTMHVFTLVFMFLILTASGFAGRALSRRHRQDAQHKRDMRAQQLLEAAQIKKVPDFSLFLRAFETTGRMPRQEELPLSPGFDPRMDEDRTTDFERVLAEAVENGLPLVALGTPGEQIGAGRIMTSEDRWKEDVALLATGALVIFLFPSTRPGTLWETGWLIQHAMIKKAIFVMPPMRKKSIFFKSGGQTYDWRSIWPELASSMRNRGIEFPEYDDKGQLFALGNDFRVSVSTKLRAADYRFFMMRDVRRQLMGMADQLRSARLGPDRIAHLSSAGERGSGRQA